MDRRVFVRVAAAGAAFLGAGAFRWPPTPRELAEAAGAWIRAQARSGPDGLTWPVAPSESPEDVYHLYSGTPGIVLFLLELHHATGNERYLREAESGARQLARSGIQSLGTLHLPDWGLYTGLAGVAYTLSEVFRAGGDDEIGTAAETSAARLIDDARPLGDGVAWFTGEEEGAVYDIISGSAGIGLALLYLHEARKQAGALDLATAAGRLLASKGRPVDEGLKWPLSEAYPRLMPNFSHGTAGVAYFLARLCEATGDEAFLAPAVQGARYLQSIATCDSEDGCLIFHHEPEGEELFYLGWCHGPVGTARLFHQLALVTGEAKWTTWPERGARGIRRQNIPSTRTEGFWNNVSQCCGDAGVGDFFLDLHANGLGSDTLPFARRLADYLVEEATQEARGARWIQAENRTQPENVIAQTGWMQGAAGVGAFLLHLDGVESGRGPRIVFPDSPWRVSS